MPRALPVTSTLRGVKAVTPLFNLPNRNQGASGISRRSASNAGTPSSVVSSVRATSGSMARSGKDRPPLITSARFSKSLDADQRNKRYLITMAVRVASFATFACPACREHRPHRARAALLPGIAVIPANAVDQRTPPAPVLAAEPTHRLALTSGEIIRGEVD